MKYTFFCYPKCSTCKKAEKWLQENNINYEYRDIVVNNPSYDEIKKIIESSNIAINKYFNASGLVYKELSLKDKIHSLSDKEKFDLLASNGKLIKRPLIFNDNLVIVGFNEVEYEHLKGQ